MTPFGVRRSAAISLEKGPAGHRERRVLRTELSFAEKTNCPDLAKRGSQQSAREVHQRNGSASAGEIKRPFQTPVSKAQSAYSRRSSESHWMASIVTSFFKEERLYLKRDFS